MADNRKEQERAEPHRTIWGIANDPRFSPAGVLAPKSKADLAFIMHALSWLATSGTAAIVCFPGIFYRGGAEQKIRQYLIDNNFVDCVIQLPDNLFYGTSIATCIMVLKKSKREAVDIRALNVEIDRIVAREDVLRKEINAIIAEIEGVAV